MAYTKKTWVSGETPCSSENFNHMEQGIADAHNKLDELNTNKIKVKTKRYQITAVYDSNIQLYKASISIANDIPAGNILTTLITGSNSTGYAEYGPRWFLYDSNIICNAELPGTFMATVTWLYL